jgi:hypothetical protein
VVGPSADKFSVVFSSSETVGLLLCAAKGTAAQMDEATFNARAQAKNLRTEGLIVGVIAWFLLHEMTGGPIRVLSGSASGRLTRSYRRTQHRVRPVVRRSSSKGLLPLRTGISLHEDRLAARITFLLVRKPRGNLSAGADFCVADMPIARRAQMTDEQASR